ncbi:MAG: sugar-binding transcriptional regulator [Marmoricola sp.]
MVAQAHPARTPTEHGPAWLVQAATIARLYLLEGRSKVDIAAELGLSRFKVARILDEARELGLVEVSIRLPPLLDAEASVALQRHLGIARALVLAGDAPTARVRENLGRVAADLLDEIVTAHDVLGLSCSRSVTATTQALSRLSPCEVVQLTGTLAGGSEVGSVESVRRAAQVGGGDAFPMYAPMVLTDPATARALEGQPGIGETLARAGATSVAAVAVGGWAEGLSTVWEAASPEERSSALDAGAVGEIGGRLFDAAGAAVESNLDGRVLGVTLATLARIPHVVALASDAGRADAVRAAVRGGIVDTLVVDHALAVRLIDLSG